MGKAIAEKFRRERAAQERRKQHEDEIESLHILQKTEAYQKLEEYCRKGRLNTHGKGVFQYLKEEGVNAEVVLERFEDGYYYEHGVTGASPSIPSSDLRYNGTTAAHEIARRYTC